MKFDPVSGDFGEWLLDGEAGPLSNPVVLVLLSVAGGTETSGWTLVEEIVADLYRAQRRRDDELAHGERA